jgi:hypothetical protein
MQKLFGGLAFALLILTCSVGRAQSPAATQPSNGSPTDTIDVQHVIESYHEAVVAHDVARLTKLFLPQGSLWLNVLSDETYASAKAKLPTATKVRVGSYTDFLKLLSTSKADFNPTHTNLQVKTDGTIASVYFDFSFLVDGKEQNRGSETWVLVKGTDGWRIAALTFSSYPSAG